MESALPERFGQTAGCIERSFYGMMQLIAAKTFFTSPAPILEEP